MHRRSGPISFPGSGKLWLDHPANEFQKETSLPPIVTTMKKNILGKISIALLGSVLAVALVALCIPYKKARADASGTIYNLYAWGLQQLTGSPGPGTVAQPTFAATVTLGTNTQSSGIVQQILGVSTVSSTCTVNAGAVSPFGQVEIVICTASSSGTVTYTFGTSFLPTATVVATGGKSITVMWVSDGTNFHEICRSASAQ